MLLGNSLFSSGGMSPLLFKEAGACGAGREHGGRGLIQSCNPPVSVEPAEDAEDPGAQVMWPLLFANQPPGQPGGVSSGAEVCPRSSGIVREGCSHPSLCRGMLLLCPPAHVGLVAAALGGSSQARGATCSSMQAQGISPLCVCSLTNLPALALSWNNRMVWVGRDL